MLIKLPNIKLKKEKNRRHCYNSDCRVALSIFFYSNALPSWGLADTGSDCPTQG